MKLRRVIGLGLVVIVLTGASLAAQTCDDDEAMAASTVQTITDLVSTVKKENLADFENKYHQKTAESNLTFAVSTLDEAAACLAKAPADPTAAAQAAALRAKGDADSKLRDRLKQYLARLKAQTNAKAAKAMLEGLDLTK